MVRAQQRRFSEAEPLLLRAATADPANADAQNNLGNVLLELGRPVEAAERFRQAIAVRPQFAEAHYNLGNALRRLDQPDGAIAAYKAAIARSGYRDAMFNLADLLRGSPQPADAIDFLERLLALHPRDGEAHALLGLVLHQIGRVAEALTRFDRAVALNPRLAGAHYNRVRMTTVGPDDPQLPVMQGLVARAQELSEVDRSLLRMALGKAYEDLGRYDEAFENFREGKRLKRKLVPYDEAAMTARFEALHRVFTPALMAAWPSKGIAAGSESELPIFVVGFPRSGTTLVEQILASHPQVHGAGEVGYLDHVAAPFRAAAAPGLGYPDYLAHLDAAESRALGEAYVERLRSLAPTAARITDKLLENYLNIGLIHLVLPRARIIHVRRDPLDVCLSCFSINFSGGLTYTSELGELGRTYRRYLELMAHWRRLLPPGRDAGGAV